MDANRPMRVLVVRVGAMGDVLHGLPAVAALRNRMPEAHLGWAIDARWAPLVEGDGQIVDRVHRVPVSMWKNRPFSGQTIRSILALRREMMMQDYDVCVDLQGTIRSSVIGRLSGAPRRVGPVEAREHAATWLYNDTVSTRAGHVIRQACELMSAAISQRLVPAAVPIPCDPVSEAWCLRALGEPGFSLLAPTAGWGAKQWPAERFGELGRALMAEGHRVMVNSAREGDATGRKVAALCGAERVVCSVSQLIAMVRAAKLVIGGDTGPVHLAAALGRPTVALFGPTDPARNGPDFPGARVRVLRDPRSTTSHKRVAATEAGLQRISVEQVLEAVHSVKQEGWDG